MDRELDAELESIGELAGGLESESEWELLEDEFAGEYEDGEFLGTIGRGVGSLLGESELEDELGEWGEFEDESEEEEFFRRIRRGIGRFVRRAAPLLRRVARVAAPMVGTAVGGFLGGPLGARVGSMAGRLAQRGLGEDEFEYEEEVGLGSALEDEGEEEWEAEMEAEAPLTHQEALAEYMAAVASRAQTEEEAEAMAGAATTASLSRADRATLRQMLPHLVRGTAILTRLLRRRAATRPAVRTVPTIVRRTTQVLASRAATGQPVTRRTAARVMANQTRRVLSSPRTCAAAIQRNVRTSRTMARRLPARPTARRRVRV
ncbi:MAG: hypothetical protein BroJett011_75380 [Chloroflexota bacterium]|nr:MAG: hypothetical protein BroJett011_75380 [Chloroflexota bacterium]